MTTATTCTGISITHSKTKTQHQRLVARNCIADARARIGAGWEIIGSDLRWALIAENILAVFSAQDPETCEQAHSAFVFVEGVRRAAFEIFNAEGGR